MKKFVVMAAAAALLSGISFAHAQSSMSPTSDKTQSKSTTNGAFCLDVQGTKKCTFATLADCQKEVSSSGGSCAPNAAKGATTGSGMSGSTSSGASGSGMKK
ncbi:MAG: hypothetical protein JO205_00125 [Pseudolabrys sp.]|nr:hypothetical protein [Pseudolabrys sp.]MBV9259753.1 hypothetical protein [Pseudolabrys sp.]